MKTRICCLAILLLASVGMLAQVTASGAVEGNVADASKAVVTGATVSLTDKATGSTRTTTTGDTGNYRFDPVAAGTYTVKIEKAGFSTMVQTVEVLVGRTVTINAPLKAGSTSEVVEVTGVAPIIDQQKTGVSQEITPTQINDLPLVGRDVANLAYLAPGVKASDSYDPTKNRYAVLSVNGSTGRNVNVTVNGIDNKDNTVGGPVMQLPLEAVQEFVISTQRFSAANGRTEGAAINMVTKSGSNRYHGSGFGFFRNQDFNTVNEQEQLNGGTKADYSRQFFGGSIGGPIVKDKAFVFFAIERQREHSAQAESASALTQLNLVTALGAVPSATIPTPFFETRYNGRMDYKFNDKHSAYVSYSSQANNSLNDQAGSTGDVTEGNFTVNHLQVANVTFTSLLTPTLVNTFTGGFQYWNNLIGSNTSVPFITFPSANFGTNVNVPQQSIQRKFQFKDDISKTWGNHNFKTGIDFLYEPFLGGYFESNSTLEIDFNKDPSVILASPALFPQGFATPGLISGMAASVGNPLFTTAPDGKMLGLYFQDDWKVTSRLTLSLGLRYDKDFNLFGEQTQGTSRTYQELVAINSPMAASIPHEDNLDFSPRVGFAYDLTGAGKHVLRGGFGLYYGQTFQNIPLFMEQQANATIYQGVFSIGQGASCVTSCVPGTAILLQNWRYGVDPMPTIPAPSGTLNPGSTGRLMDPNYRNPYSEQMNIGYQWALNNNSVFEAEYIHELALHEDKTVNTNPTILAAGGARPLSAAFAAAGQPVLGRISDEQAVGRSRYDGMNLSYRRRMSQHFSLTANYTLSRALAYEGSAGAFRNASTIPSLPTNPNDFGPVPNDERHHFTAAGTVKFPFGIEVSPIMQAGSARPYNLTEDFDVYGFGSGVTRPMIVPISAPTNYTAFAKGAQTTAAAQAAVATCLAAATCMQLPFDPVRGQAFFQLDTRFSKNIKLGEGRNLALMYQAFNITDRANHGNNFGGVVGSSTFLQPAGFINPSSVTTPRSLWGEFGARFSF